MGKTENHTTANDPLAAIVEVVNSKKPRNKKPVAMFIDPDNLATIKAMAQKSGLPQVRVLNEGLRIFFKNTKTQSEEAIA